jgi:HrpA-like RNA helicase
MDPPSDQAIMGALDSLKDVGALDQKRKLTPLGHHLAYVPIDLRLAKILLYGAIFRCVDPTASIVACIGAGRSPLLNPPDKREEAKEAHKQFVVRYSDHLTLLRVYEAWVAVPTRERRRWCGANFLSETSLQEIAALRKQLLAALMEMGFLPSATKDKWNQHSKYPKVRHLFWVLLFWTIGLTGCHTFLSAHRRGGLRRSLPENRPRPEAQS